MRTIKFRGQSVMDGKWFHGDLINSDGFTNPRIRYLFDDAEFLEEEVMSETVGQLTGVTDCNEREIYEGDIMRIKGNHNRGFGIVTWHQNGYFYIDDSFGKFPRDCVKPIGDFLAAISSHFKGMELEVCGNIHDRPEIIKKEV